MKTEKSCVPIKCKECKDTVETTNLSNFANGGQLGCDCHLKSESKVKNFLQKRYGGAKNVKRGKRFEWCKNKQMLPYDLVIMDLKIIVEVDGPQHFEEVKHFKDLTLEERMERDNFKENKAKENGYCMVRVLQTDVYREENEWREKLLKAIDDVQVDRPCVLKLWEINSIN